MVFCGEGSKSGTLELKRTAPDCVAVEAAPA
jgi:hypothetical protein